MQSLDVISINIWHILISLINLVIIFLIMKKILFKPIKKILSDRQKAIENQYADADKALADAEANKATWENKLKDADEEADAIIKSATDKAKLRAEKIVEDADKQAMEMTRRAKEQIVLERKKAEQEMKEEIIEVSTAIAEKMIEREVNPHDHRDIIDSFIENIGSDDDGNL